jgi:hypothetical protein
MEDGEEEFQQEEVGAMSVNWWSTGTALKSEVFKSVHQSRDHLSKIGTPSSTESGVAEQEKKPHSMAQTTWALTKSCERGLMSGW